MEALPEIPVVPLPLFCFSFSFCFWRGQDILATHGVKEAVMEQLKACASEERPWEQVRSIYFSRARPTGAGGGGRGGEGGRSGYHIPQSSLDL